MKTKKSDWINFLLRLIVVIIFHLIFKQGDQSFSSAFEASPRSIVFSIYFIAFWMLFWQLCRIIYQQLTGQFRDKKAWYRKLPVVSVILIVLVIIFSGIFSLGYTLIDHYFGVTLTDDLPLFNPEIIPFPSLSGLLNINPELLFGFIFIFLLVYGTHLFFTSLRNTKELEVLSAEQNKENIAAKYEALKNQVDPHFFFNSLSVLSSLIHESTDLSDEYISHLSKHYRYILETNNENRVPLSKEFDHLNSYFYLMTTRYPKSIFLSASLSEPTLQKCRILSHSLLMLVENAVKHNNFTSEDPLVIEIAEDDNYIVVSNRMNKKNLAERSTGIGLRNIRQRYSFEGKKQVLTEETDNHFIVKLPKLI